MENNLKNNIYIYISTYIIRVTESLCSTLETKTTL